MRPPGRTRCGSDEQADGEDRSGCPAVPHRVGVHAVLRQGWQTAVQLLKRG